MQKRFSLVFSLTPAMIMLTLSFTQCTSHTEVVARKENSLLISDSLLNRLKIDTVQNISTSNIVSLTGKITADEDKMIKIYPMVSGIVNDIHVQVGDEVKAHQLLAVMQSMEVAGYNKESISSEADVNTAQRNLSATEDMYKSGLSSELDLTQAKNELKKAIAENQRSKRVSQLNGGGKQTYDVTSPIAGFVIEKKVTNNMQLRADNADNMFAIADLSSVWVMVNVYESDISKLHSGEKVCITTIAYPDKVFEGKIDKIYDMLDPDNKVMKARIKIVNTGYLLKPEMFASVKVQTGAQQEMPFISTDNLIFDNGKYYVIALDNKNKPRIQEVEIPLKIEKRAYVKAGLEPGDRIIASRQLYVYEAMKN